MDFLNWRKLLFLWELPQLILGAVIFLIFRKKVSKIFHFKDVLFIAVKDFKGGISLGWLVIINKKYINDMFTLKHEYGHSIQSLILGWLYLIIIGLPSITLSIISNIFKWNNKKYHSFFPEHWADKLGNN